MVAKTSVNVEAHSIYDNTTVPLNLKNLRLFNSGAFSNVYRGNIDGANGRMEIVVKKTWGSRKEDSRLNTEEISILKMLNRLNHKNIVRLLYTFTTHYPNNICYSLVFEFLPMNLYQYLKTQDRKLQLIETKLFTWQLFRGLYHLERANIVHRDVKPQNLLVEPESGLLKISDFGSSCIDPNGPMPSYHVTRYYRPPELLLGSHTYGTGVDVWSAGCVLAEMLGGKVVFAGKNTGHQLDLLLSCFGLPSSEDISAMQISSSKWREAKSRFLAGKDSRVSFKKLVPISLDQCDEAGQDLVQRVLVYNPGRRLHGEEMLKNSFFDEIFKKGAKRPHGRTITCLSLEDRKAVEKGDKSMTASSDMSGE